MENEIEKLRAWNKWFFGRVSFMRYCQKEYFRTRDQKMLQQSKSVEREVDEEINRIQALLLKQHDPNVRQLMLDFETEPAL